MTPLALGLTEALRHWKAILAGAVILALAAALLLTRATLASEKQARADEAHAHRIKVANYRIASAQARLDLAANLQRVADQRRSIDERVIYVYQEQRASTAAAGERLRTQAAAYLGSAGGADLSAEREATCRAVAGAGCEAIPALLKAAQDNTDQLVALIAWAKAQSEVETSPKEPR